MTQSTILETATNGIDRGYRSSVQVDFLATNTFTNAALCNRTFPKDPNGACPEPADVPCPK